MDASLACAAQLRIQRGQLFGRADVVPGAAEHLAAHPPGVRRAIKPRKQLPGLRPGLLGEQRGMKHADIAVVEPRALAPDAALRVQRHVAVAVVFGVGGEHEMRRGVLRIGGDGVGRCVQARVVVGGVDVGADHEKGRGAEQGQGGGDAAAGLISLRRLGRVAQAHAQGAAVAQRSGNLRPQPAGVDDEVAPAARGQALDLPDDQRLAPHGQQGLGASVGEGPHALPASGGKNHGALGQTVHVQKV